MDPVTGSAAVTGSSAVELLDHLVFAVPDLDSGTRLVEQRLGVQSAPGGRHVGLGTRNRLVGLGPGRYLEIVAVDPEQPTPSRPRWFGLDDLHEAKLVTWCVKSPDLHALVRGAREAGLDLGEPVAGSRDRPDGTRLSWTFTDPRAPRGDGVVPFFIDWGDSPHPGDELPAACSFLGVRVEHPEPERISTWFRAVGLDTPVSRAHAPRIVASLDTPDGIVEIS